MKEKAYVRSQFTAANTLLDSGKTFEALSILDKALHQVPGESQLESLRGIIRERLTQEESEDHLRRSLEQGAKGSSAATSTRLSVPSTAPRRSSLILREVDDLLHRAETLRVRERSVQQILASSQKLLDDKEPLSAVQLLEGAAQHQSDGRIVALLADARRHLDQFQRGLESTVNEGERILHQKSTGQREEAVAFLQAQPSQYASTPRFQGLVDRIHKRGAAEVLDQQHSRKIPGPNRRFASRRRLCARAQETKKSNRRLPPSVNEKPVSPQWSKELASWKLPFGTKKRRRNSHTCVSCIPSTRI